MRDGALPAQSASVPDRYPIDRWSIDVALRYWMVIRLFADRYRPDLEIVELGSGSGGVAQFLQHPVTGVDTAFDRTTEASAPLLTPVNGSALDVPLADRSFDIVLSLEMLEHLADADRVRAIDEMLRLVRPGGRAIMTFPAGDTARRLDRRLNAAWRRKHGEDHQWALEHLLQGVPDAPQILALVRERAGTQDRITLLKHTWAPAWLFYQLLFYAGTGYPITRLVGLHSTPMAKLLFRLIRRANFGRCYRAIIVVDRARA